MFNVQDIGCEQGGMMTRSWEPGSQAKYFVEIALLTQNITKYEEKKMTRQPRNIKRN